MAKLKIDDLVIIERRGNDTALDKIIGITKSGNYKTERNGIYYPSGMSRGGGDWSRTYIRKATPKMVDKWKKERLKSIIAYKLKHDVNWNNIDLEILQKIVKILGLET